MTTWVYKQSEPGLWTVGHYWSDGDRDHWEPESDHDSTEEAALRVRFLNGAGPVGICGARLTDSSGRWTHHFVCTKGPGHVEAGDREHEDLTRGGAPLAKWRQPTDEEMAKMYGLPRESGHALSVGADEDDVHDPSDDLADEHDARDVDPADVRADFYR